MVLFAGNRICSTISRQDSSGFWIFLEWVQTKAVGWGCLPESQWRGSDYGTISHTPIYHSKNFYQKKFFTRKALLLSDYFCNLSKIFATISEHFWLLYVNVYVYCTSSKYSLEDMRNDKYRDYPVLYTIRHSMWGLNWDKSDWYKLTGAGYCLMKV